MKFTAFGGLVVSALLIAIPLGIASAADMPLKAPPPVAAPAYSWTGFYIGINGGADWFNKSWFVPDTPTNVAGGCAIAGCNYSVGSHSSTSGLFGGQVGFNYQISQWVLGVEAEADWTRLQGSNLVTVTFLDTLFGFANNSKTDALGTIAGRLGVTWDRTLLYAKGGAAWAHDTFWETAIPCATICQSTTNTRWGWVAGVGVEQALTLNWSVKLEYEHLGLGNATETLQPVCVGFCQAFQYNVRQTVDLIKVGINYRFGGYGPLTAKY
jgi:outer membrane immunogenic protein